MRGLVLKYERKVGGEVKEYNFVFNKLIRIRVPPSASLFLHGGNLTLIKKKLWYHIGLELKNKNLVSKNLTRVGFLPSASTSLHGENLVLIDLLDNTFFSF